MALRTKQGPEIRALGMALGAGAPWVFLNPVCDGEQGERLPLFQRGGWLCVQDQEGRAGGAGRGTRIVWET